MWDLKLDNWNSLIKGIFTKAQAGFEEINRGLCSIPRLERQLELSPPLDLKELREGTSYWNLERSP